MSTHNICFRGEIRKIFCGYPHFSGALKYVRSIDRYYSNSSSDIL